MRLTGYDRVPARLPPGARAPARQPRGAGGSRARRAGGAGAARSGDLGIRAAPLARGAGQGSAGRGGAGRRHRGQEPDLVGLRGHAHVAVPGPGRGGPPQPHARRPRRRAVRGRAGGAARRRFQGAAAGSRPTPPGSWSAGAPIGSSRGPSSTSSTPSAPWTSCCAPWASTTPAIARRAAIPATSPPPTARRDPAPRGLGPHLFRPAGDRARDRPGRRGAPGAAQALRPGRRRALLRGRARRGGGGTPGGAAAQSPPRFPAATRDVSFWIASSVTADEQRAAMAAAAEPLLRELAVLEDFRDPRYVAARQEGDALDDDVPRRRPDAHRRRGRRRPRARRVGAGRDAPDRHSIVAHPIAAERGVILTL